MFKNIVRDKELTKNTILPEGLGYLELSGQLLYNLRTSNESCPVDKKKPCNIRTRQDLQLLTQLYRLSGKIQSEICAGLATFGSVQRFL